MPRAEEKVWTIVVGGGSGQRFGRPKQFEMLDDRRVVDHARLGASAVSDGVVLVVPPGEVDGEQRATGADVVVVAGGATRSESVRAGLSAVPADADIICVHDAARPLATVAVYRGVIAAVIDGADAAVPGVPVTDTIKEIEPGDDTSPVIGNVVATPDRARLVAVQTPQAFRADVLRAAHASGGDATDDAALVEAAGGTVVVTHGDAANRKITRPEDLEWARTELAARAVDS